MGETHPAAKKVVLEFCTADLPLTASQRTKLIKLVGVRYNPQTDLVKMSSEMFETQAQNKRYLGDLVDTLIAEARDNKETFEDIPVGISTAFPSMLVVAGFGSCQMNVELTGQWKTDSTTVGFPASQVQAQAGISRGVEEEDAAC